MFAGLRPMTRTISASAEITTYDCEIIVVSSSAVTITLPSDAELGQCLTFYHTNLESTSVKHTYKSKSNTHTFNNPIATSNRWGQTSLNINSYGVVRFILAEDQYGVKYWWYYRLR